MPIQRHCRVSGLPFTISGREAEFCEKEGIELPMCAPTERWRQMFLFRNRRNLYRSTCPVSRKGILTIYPPMAEYNIVDVSVWESDGWDGTDWGRPYDFSRPFFEQLFELIRQVPIPALPGAAGTRENCDYVIGVSHAKNCYLVFGGGEITDCLYCQNIQQSLNLIDCTIASECELCYECRNVRNCYNLAYSEHCVSCSDSTFLSHCQNCKDCYGCVNLSNKKNCLWNVQLSPEEFRRRRAAIDLGLYSSLAAEQTRFSEFQRQFSLRAYIGVRNEDSSGNYLYDTKQCADCINCRTGADLEHCMGLYFSQDSYFHLYFGERSSLIYNSVNCGIDVQELQFCSDIRMNCSRLAYCTYCTYGVSECFGCAGLKRKSYCILNKQYSKTEYQELKRRIISQMAASGEWGSFFPSKYSPHYYNSCEANDVFPLSRQEAEARGYPWETDTSVAGEDAVDPGRLHIADAGSEVLAQTFRCSATARPFRIIRGELELLRQQRLALPVHCPTERLKQRAALLLYHGLGSRNCPSCSIKFATPYHEEARDVLCEACFADSM